MSENKLLPLFAGILVGGIIGVLVFYSVASVAETTYKPLSGVISFDGFVAILFLLYVLGKLIVIIFHNWQDDVWFWSAIKQTIRENPNHTTLILGISVLLPLYTIICSHYSTQTSL